MSSRDTACVLADGRTDAFAEELISFAATGLRSQLLTECAIALWDTVGQEVRDPELLHVCRHVTSNSTLKLVEACTVRPPLCLQNSICDACNTTLIAFAVCKEP